MEPKVSSLIFPLISLTQLIIPVVIAAFIIYFLTKVINFMKLKNEHDALLLKKIDKLIDLQRSNRQTNKVE